MDDRTGTRENSLAASATTESEDLAAHSEYQLATADKKFNEGVLSMLSAPERRTPKQTSIPPRRQTHRNAFNPQVKMPSPFATTATVEPTTRVARFVKERKRSSLDTNTQEVLQLFNHYWGSKNYFEAAKQLVKLYEVLESDQQDNSDFRECVKLSYCLPNTSLGEVQLSTAAARLTRGLRQVHESRRLRQVKSQADEPSGFVLRARKQKRGVAHDVVLSSARDTKTDSKEEESLSDEEASSPTASRAKPSTKFSTRLLHQMDERKIETTTKGQVENVVKAFVCVHTVSIQLFEQQHQSNSTSERASLSIQSAKAKQAVFLCQQFNLFTSGKLDTLNPAALLSQHYGDIFDLVNKVFIPGMLACDCAIDLLLKQPDSINKITELVALEEKVITLIHTTTQLLSWVNGKIDKLTDNVKEIMTRLIPILQARLKVSIEVTKAAYKQYTRPADHLGERLQQLNQVKTKGLKSLFVFVIKAKLVTPQNTSQFKEIVYQYHHGRASTTWSWFRSTPAGFVQIFDVESFDGFNKALSQSQPRQSVSDGYAALDDNEADLLRFLEEAEEKEVKQQRRVRQPDQKQMVGYLNDAIAAGNIEQAYLDIQSLSAKDSKLGDISDENSQQLVVNFKELVERKPDNMSDFVTILGDSENRVSFLFYCILMLENFKNASGEPLVQITIACALSTHMSIFSDVNKPGQPGRIKPRKIFSNPVDNSQDQPEFDVILGFATCFITGFSEVAKALSNIQSQTSWFLLPWSSKTYDEAGLSEIHANCKKLVNLFDAAYRLLKWVMRPENYSAIDDKSPADDLIIQLLDAVDQLPDDVISHSSSSVTLICKMREQVPKLFRIAGTFRASKELKPKLLRLANKFNTSGKGNLRQAVVDTRVVNKFKRHSPQAESKRGHFSGRSLPRHRRRGSEGSDAIELDSKRAGLLSGSYLSTASDDEVERKRGPKGETYQPPVPPRPPAHLTTLAPPPRSSSFHRGRGSRSAFHLVGKPPADTGVDLSGVPETKHKVKRNGNGNNGKSGRGTRRKKRLSGSRLVTISPHSSQTPHQSSTDIPPPPVPLRPGRTKDTKQPPKVNAENLSFAAALSFAATRSGATVVTQSPRPHQLPPAPRDERSISALLEGQPADDEKSDSNNSTPPSHTPPPLPTSDEDTDTKRQHSSASGATSALVSHSVLAASSRGRESDVTDGTGVTPADGDDNATGETPSV